MGESAPGGPPKIRRSKLAAERFKDLLMIRVRMFTGKKYKLNMKNQAAI